MRMLTFPSPLGALTLTEEEGALTELRFGDLGGRDLSPLLMHARREIGEYLAGERREFDLPLSPSGTPFQREVWRALQAIPYGECRTYGAIAAAIDRPKAFRAVGMANHCNPLPLLIPCHRVVGADGRLTGYAGGLERKRFLLAIEGLEQWK